MNVLYLIIGKHNIESWDDNEIQDISLDEVKRIEFTDEESRQTTIAILEQFVLEDYIILDENEYNFLINGDSTPYSCDNPTCRKEYGGEYNGGYCSDECRE